MKNFKVVARDNGVGEMYVYGDIGTGFFDGVSAIDVRNELKGLGDVDTIDVHINSMGGDIFDGIAIMNQLKSHTATINVIVDGMAASAASVIAMAGDTIEMRQGSQMMIHEPWTITMGGAKDLRKTADIIEMTASEMAGIYASKSGKSVTEVMGIMADETFYTAETAVQNGFATSTVAAPAIAACGGEWRAHVPGFPKVETPPEPEAKPEPAPKPKLTALEKALTMARKAT